MGKVLFWILFLLFGVPLILSIIMMGVGVGTQAYFAASILQTFGQLGLFDDLPEKEEWNVVNVRHENHLASAYRTIVEPERLQSARSISVSALATTSDLTMDQRLVSVGEADNAMRLYAPQFATEECGRLKEVIASECVVEQTSVRKLDTRVFEISARMTFTVKEPFGTVPEAVPLAFVEVDQYLVSEGNLGRSVPHGSQAELRMTMYRSAARACQQTRRNNGNCAIRNVTINLVRNGPIFGTPRLQGSATLSMLKPQ